MIDERLMQPGRWSLKLKPETPLAIRSQIRWRDHFAVTPGRFQRPTYNAVVAASIYTGVVLERQRGGPADPLTYAGLNLLYWLGDTTAGRVLTGGGDVTDGFRADTITTLLNEMWNSDVTVGGLGLTLSSVPATTVVDIVETEGRDVTVMQLIDRWRRKTDGPTEFSIRHTGGIVFSEEGAGSAFVQTPTLLVTRDAVVGVSGGVRNVQAARIDETADAYDEDYLIEVEATDGLSNGGATNPDVVGYRSNLDLAANSNARYRNVSTSEVSGAGAAQDYACDLLAWGLMRFQRRKITIDLPAGSLTPNVDIKAGDHIWLYDPFVGATDNTNEVYANGTELHPQKVRVSSLSWAPQPGHAVWWLKTQSGDADGTNPDNAVDITEWVDEWGGMVRLEIDTAPPVRPPAFRSGKLS